MATIAELVRGIWLDGLDDETSQEVQALCSVIDNGLTDAVLSLALFEQAAGRSPRRDDAEWARDREAERLREAELEAPNPHPFDATDSFEWRMRITEQARRDVQRAKWNAGELPESYARRLPFLHARGFLTALAQLSRALWRLGRLDTGEWSKQVRAASAALETALPALKPVRDSVEHAEDRMRGRNKRGQKMTLAPVANAFVHAPGGGVLMVDVLNGRNFGCTVEDGSYAEIEVSDATIEIARSAVQEAYDALPWKDTGYRHHVPVS